MTPEMFDELEAERELMQKVLRGLVEAQTTALIDDEDVWQEVEQCLKGPTPSSRPSSTEADVAFESLLPTDLE